MNKDKFLASLRIVLERAEDIEEVDRERLLSFLSEARFATMPYEDLTLLTEVIEKTQLQIEQEVLDTGDPGMINDMNELLEAVNEVNYAAAVKTFADQGVTEGGVGQAKDGQWLLDRFAGLAE